jgi:hypothetical protein
VSSWSEAYLALLREDHSLCLPFLDLDRIADSLGVPAKTLKNRRAVRKDVRDAEAEIVGEHLGRLRAQAVVEGGPGAAEEDLPFALERYLEVYAELDRSGQGGRQDAARQLQEEGIPISWQDIKEARRRFSAFDRALSDLWDEGNEAVEDKNRRKALEGSQAAISLYLKGNMPGKYGDKARIDHFVHQGHQLEDGDQGLVEDVKGRHFPRPRRQVPASVEDDVVEGEVLSS